MKTNETTLLITREQYMQNSSELHHVYYLQFATESTKQFILGSLSIDKIKDALSGGDEHLNKIKIPYNNMNHGGGWWWDNAPINMQLLREAGESNSHLPIHVLQKRWQKNWQNRTNAEAKLKKSSKAMKYTYIKTHNMIEFFAVKTELLERGMVYTGGTPSHGLNIIKIDSIGIFGMGTFLDWVMQTETGNEQEQDSETNEY